MFDFFKIKKKNSRRKLKYKFWKENKNFRRKPKILEGKQNINFRRKTKILEGNQNIISIYFKQLLGYSDNTSCLS